MNYNFSSKICLLSYIVNFEVYVSLYPNFFTSLRKLNISVIFLSVSSPHNKDLKKRYFVLTYWLSIKLLYPIFYLLQKKIEIMYEIFTIIYKFLCSSQFGITFFGAGSNKIGRWPKKSGNTEIKFSKIDMKVRHWNLWQRCAQSIVSIYYFMITLISLIGVVDFSFKKIIILMFSTTVHNGFFPSSAMNTSGWNGSKKFVLL